MGLYLGQSPSHSTNVSLILNLNTDLVSPQFHVQHNHFFESVRKDLCQPSSFTTSYPWKNGCAFDSGIIIQSAKDDSSTSSQENMSVSERAQSQDNCITASEGDQNYDIITMQYYVT